MLKSRGPGDTRESLMLLADRYENPNYELSAQEHSTSLDWGWLREKEKTKSYEFYTYLTVEIALERWAFLINQIKITYYTKFMLGGPKEDSGDGNISWLRSVLDESQAMLDEMKWLWDFVANYNYPHPMVFDEQKAPEWRKRRGSDFFYRALKKNNAVNYVCLMRDMVVLLEADREDPFI